MLFSNTYIIRLEQPVPMRLFQPFKGKSNNRAGADVAGAGLYWRDLKMFPADKRKHVTRIRLTDGVYDLGSALDHFSGQYNLGETDLTKEAGKSAGPVTSEFFDIGNVITINLSAAGWRPGNTAVYILSPDQTQAVFMNPTYHLKFDWTKAVIQWKE